MGGHRLQRPHRQIRRTLGGTLGHAGFAAGQGRHRRARRAAQQRHPRRLRPRHLRQLQPAHPSRPGDLLGRDRGALRHRGRRPVLARDDVRSLGHRRRPVGRQRPAAHLRSQGRQGHVVPGVDLRIPRPDPLACGGQVRPARRLGRPGRRRLRRGDLAVRRRRDRRRRVRHLDRTERPAVPVAELRPDPQEVDPHQRLVRRKLGDVAGRRRILLAPTAGAVPLGRPDETRLDHRLPVRGRAFAHHRHLRRLAGDGAGQEACAPGQHRPRSAPRRHEDLRRRGQGVGSAVPRPVGRLDAEEGRLLDALRGVHRRRPAGRRAHAPLPSRLGGRWGGRGGGPPRRPHPSGCGERPPPIRAVTARSWRTSLRRPPSAGATRLRWPCTTRRCRAGRSRSRRSSDSSRSRGRASSCRWRSAGRVRAGR